MKEEKKKKIKKVALIGLQAVLGAFALLGVVSSVALCKSCSKGEGEKTSIRTTTPVIRPKQTKNNVTSNFQSWADIRGKKFQGKTGLTYNSIVNASSGFENYAINSLTTIGELTWNGVLSEMVGVRWQKYSSAAGLSAAWKPQQLDQLWTSGGGWNSYLQGRYLKFYDVDQPANVTLNSSWFSNFNYCFEYVAEDVPLSVSTTNCYEYGSTPSAVPQSGSVQLEFVSDSGYGFVNQYGTITNSGLVTSDISYGAEIVPGFYGSLVFKVALGQGSPSSTSVSVVAQKIGPALNVDYDNCQPTANPPLYIPENGYTIVFEASYGYGFPYSTADIADVVDVTNLEILSYTPGGDAGNGLAATLSLTLQPIDMDTACSVAVTPKEQASYVNPDWTHIDIQAPNCSYYAYAGLEFNSEGYVEFQVFPDIGYYFDPNNDFYGTQFRQFYGANVTMVQASSGGLIVRVTKDTSSLVNGKTPLVAFYPLADGQHESTGDMANAFNLFKDGFSAMLPLLMIQILPGITLGVLLFVPFVVALVLFIIKVIRK